MKNIINTAGGVVTAASAVTETKQWRAALYLRLSKDDDEPFWYKEMYHCTTPTNL